jgi:hypothetical protein
MKISSPKAINWTLKQYGYTGQVISMRQDFATLMEDPKGLMLSDAMVKNFLEDDGLKFETKLLPPVNRPSIGS